MTRKEVAANTVRGQYGMGEKNGPWSKAIGREGVDPQSFTETYVALRMKVDNWRWAACRSSCAPASAGQAVSEIAVEFKQPPLHLFRYLGEDDDAIAARPMSNVIVMRIQPDEGISLSIACKQPGMRIQLQEVEMDFFYGEAFQERSPEAYERLLLDALRGDASLFTRSDEVEYSWRFITAIHEAWANLPPPTFPNYYPFSDGPDEANRLLEGTQARWRPLHNG